MMIVRIFSPSSHLMELPTQVQYRNENYQDVVAMSKEKKHLSRGFNLS
jgi:hypothetical protein